MLRKITQKIKKNIPEEEKEDFYANISEDLLVYIEDDKRKLERPEVFKGGPATLEIISSMKDVQDKIRAVDFIPDEFAREDLIKGNLKLVLSILKKYNNKVDNLDDLFQVGCLGLVKAIDNFDLSYNVTLSTYACPLIIGEMKRYIRDNISLRISRSVKDLAHKIIKLREELMTIDGKMPTDKELSEILGVSEYDIANALTSLKEPVSMYEPIYNDGGDTIYLYDQLSSPKDEYDKDLKLALEKAMEKLKVRELQILRDRFLIGKTQMEIASELGISQAQISRIEKSAITNIKKLIK